MNKLRSWFCKNTPTSCLELRAKFAELKNAQYGHVSKPFSWPAKLKLPEDGFGYAAIEHGKYFYPRLSSEQITEIIDFYRDDISVLNVRVPVLREALGLDSTISWIQIESLEAINEGYDRREIERRFPEFAWPIVLVIRSLCRFCLDQMTQLERAAVEAREIPSTWDDILDWPDRPLDSIEQLYEHASAFDPLLPRDELPIVMQPVRLYPSIDDDDDSPIQSIENSRVLGRVINIIDDSIKFLEIDLPFLPLRRFMHHSDAARALTDRLAWMRSEIAGHRVGVKKPRRNAPKTTTVDQALDVILALKKKDETVTRLSLRKLASLVRAKIRSKSCSINTVGKALKKLGVASGRSIAKTIVAGASIDGVGIHDAVEIKDTTSRETAARVLKEKFEPGPENDALLQQLIDGSNLPDFVLQIADETLTKKRSVRSTKNRK